MNKIISRAVRISALAYISISFAIFAESNDWVYVRLNHIEIPNIEFGDSLKNDPRFAGMRGRKIAMLSLDVLYTEDDFWIYELEVGWFQPETGIFYDGSGSDDRRSFYCGEKVMDTITALKSCFAKSWFKVERKFLDNENNKLLNGARFVATKLPKRGKRISGKAKEREK